MQNEDSKFIGQLPKMYDQYLVPIFFDPYAKDIVTRLQHRQPQRVLEIAAGTGAVTRHLDSMLSAETKIVASDLNQPMLDQASQHSFKHAIEWKAADAQQLPFEDESFDAVVCQFGAMFFPDQPKAYSEIRRVLKPGGVFLFNVWGDIKQNDFFFVVQTAMEKLFPSDPPGFLKRIPYAYHDEGIITQHLKNGGFIAAPSIETVTFTTVADSPVIPAIAICYGTPLRNEIESRSSGKTDSAVKAATTAMTEQFGDGKVVGKMLAKVVEVMK